MSINHLCPSETSMETLSEIVVALLKNSIDANSSAIAVRICLELCWVQVLDNGNGIPKDELQSVGTSCQLNIDFDRNKLTKQYARLASSSLQEIIAKCEEVLIESVAGGRQGDGTKLHSRLFKHDAVANESQRNFESLSQYQNVRRSRGTTITLKNIFYETPEWQRDRTIKEDYTKLLVDLRMLALVHYDKSFTVQDLDTAELVFKSKKLTALLPKYCELYGLSETDIDVTTCRKDNVVIQCFFSQRQVRQALAPVQFTFVNGLPSNEFLPAVNEILTQHQYAIDFLIVANFPKNDVLTQLNEPIVKNCLFRCLSQYKACLRRRQLTPAPAPAMKAPKSLSSHQSTQQEILRNAVHQPDEEDLLYGLSQPDGDKNATFEKCSKWLQRNNFEVSAEDKSPKVKRYAVTKNTHSETDRRQPVDFFDVRSVAPRSFGKVPEETLKTPKNMPPAKIPVPKFYAQPERIPKNAKPKRIALGKQPESARKPCNAPPEGIYLKTFMAPLERKSFLNLDLKKRDSQLTFSETEIPKTSLKWTHFERKEMKKLVHIRESKMSPPPKPPDQTLELSTFLPAVKPPARKGSATSCEHDKSLLANAELPALSFKSDEADLSHNFNLPSPGNKSAACIEIPNAFMEPLFLEPMLDDDSHILRSPKAHYFGNDLNECYADFHDACQETIQHYKIAIEPFESDSSESECCCRKAVNREIETLRQPFHNPRDIFTKIGTRRY